MDILNDSSLRSELTLGFKDTETVDSRQSSRVSHGMVNHIDLKVLSISRVFVVAAMITVALISANVVFVVDTIQEENVYKQQFEQDSQLIIDTFTTNLKSKALILQNFVVSLSLYTTQSLPTTKMTSTTKKNDGGGGYMSTMASSKHQYNWPNITITEFENRCSGPQKLSHATSFSFSPLVQGDQLLSWEAYASTTTTSWVYQGTAKAVVAASVEEAMETPMASETPDQSNKELIHGILEENALYFEAGHSLQDSSSQPRKKVYRIEKGEVLDYTTTPNNNKGTDENSIFFPIWQQYPLVTTTNGGIMFNLLSSPKRSQALKEMVNQRTMTMSDILYQDSNGTDYTYYEKAHGALYSPIIRTDNNNQVVGTLSLEFPWETIFQGALTGNHIPKTINHKNIHNIASQREQQQLQEEEDNDDDTASPNFKNSHQSIVVVLESYCGNDNDNDNQYTFLIIGEQSYFIGKGDLHSQYRDDDDDEYIITPAISSYQTLAQMVQQQNPSSHSNNDTTTTVCKFRIITHPSRQYKEIFLSSRPNIYRWLVLMFFFLLISVFAIYDCFLGCYQKKMIEAATRTGDLVSTLFPSIVRDRLVEISRARKQAEESDWQTDMVNDNSNDNGNDNPGGNEFIQKRRSSSAIRVDGEPIADLFLHSTIMFADVYGFDEWSNNKDPPAVFTLLETLFQSMDIAAKKYKIFKVETVGDCYVASTGVPDARDDHAEAMIRFARHCLIENMHLIIGLEEQLGPGTEDLTMRIGIHSGPITCGVLRGEKPRFQLFGDTMNTASRMQSTGMPNKVQLSHDTADILTKRGKGHWLMPRDKSVFVKGKGNMQTYWLKYGRGPLTSRQSCSSVSSGIMTDESHEITSSTAIKLNPNENNNKEEDKNENTNTNTNTDVAKPTKVPSPVQKEKKDNTTLSKSNHGLGKSSNHSLLPPRLPIEVTDEQLDLETLDYSSKPVLHKVLGRTQLDETLERLVKWNVEILLKLLKNVVAGRRHHNNSHNHNDSLTDESSSASDSFADNGTNNVSATHNGSTPSGGVVNTPRELFSDEPMDDIVFLDHLSDSKHTDTISSSSSSVDTKKRNFLDEIDTIIPLPTVDEVIVTTKGLQRDGEPVELDPKVISELKLYVSTIATGYNKGNHFHNFEHASHVTLSVSKFLNRVGYGLGGFVPDTSNSNDDDNNNNGDDDENNEVTAVHTHTYGIGSDPLTQFAIVFSALIHDVGHTGVSNKELIKEDSEISSKYNNRSIAEQRSIEIALELLSLPPFENLRSCIFRTIVERNRFRQVIVNSVLATDLFDAEFNTIRKDRWNAAFNPTKESANNVEDETIVMKRKATMVIENILQAADISHTMQHWRIYQYWNEHLFQEMYMAFKAGRIDRDPSVGWYEGELDFFDDYVIPIATKLNDCGVFGTSSDEYLNYAHQNRNYWELRGQEVCRQMLTRITENNQRED